MNYRKDCVARRMTRLITAILLFCVVVPVLALSGCGGSGDRPDLGTVVGTVTLDGKPLPNAEILFQHEKKRFSRATTDDNGKYELNYIRDIMGAAIGKHRVVIKAKNAANRQIVPWKYNDNSILSAEVEPGHNSIDFDLKTGS